MTPENFTYWLQGFFEITGSSNLTDEQVTIIKKHLSLVFENRSGLLKDENTLLDNTVVPKYRPDWTYYPNIICGSSGNLQSSGCSEISSYVDVCTTLSC